MSNSKMSSLQPSGFGSHGDTTHPVRHQLMRSAQRAFHKGQSGGLDIGSLSPDDERMLAHRGLTASGPIKRGQDNKPSFKKHVPQVREGSPSDRS